MSYSLVVMRTTKTTNGAKTMTDGMWLNGRFIRATHPQPNRRVALRHQIELDKIRKRVRERIQKEQKG